MALLLPYIPITALGYLTGNVCVDSELPYPHCGYDIPKAHQYFPLPPPDAPIFMPDIETL